LGSIPLKNIRNSRSDIKGKTCFRTIDKEGKNWLLCTKKFKERISWVCLIREVLGYKKDKKCKETAIAQEEISPTVFDKKVTQPIILIPLASKMCNQDWNYLQKGQDWNCDCAEGKEQSPINLPPQKFAINSPIKPIFKFKEVPVKIDKKGIAKFLKIKYKNNALRIKTQSFGRAVTLDGAIYNSNEIIFHTPAEHYINGKRYDMEMQIIFSGESKGDIAKHVVLSFVFEKKPGVYNKFIDDLDFFSLPNPISKTRKIFTPLYIPKILYSAGDNSAPIFKPFSFYTYHGSLTSPPCTERTINYVAAKTIKLGSTAMELFKEAIREPDRMDLKGNIRLSNTIPENNRTLQKLNGRSIFYYDHKKFCGGFKKKRVKPIGHYEKVNKKAIDFFYVDGPKPSGLPGAFVVSKKEALGKQYD